MCQLCRYAVGTLLTSILPENEPPTPPCTEKQSLASGSKTLKWHRASHVRRGVTEDATVLMCCFSLWCAGEQDWQMENPLPLEREINPIQVQKPPHQGEYAKHILMAHVHGRKPCGLDILISTPPGVRGGAAGQRDSRTRNGLDSCKHSFFWEQQKLNSDSCEGQKAPHFLRRFFFLMWRSSLCSSPDKKKKKKENAFRHPQ